MFYVNNPRDFARIRVSGAVDTERMDVFESKFSSVNLFSNQVQAKENVVKYLSESKK